MSQPKNVEIERLREHLFTFLVELGDNAGNIDAQRDALVAGAGASRELLAVAEGMEADEVFAIRRVLWHFHDLLMASRERAPVKTQTQAAREKREEKARRKEERLIAAAALCRGKGKKKTAVANKLAPRVGLNAEDARKLLNRIFPKKAWDDPESSYPLP